MPDVPANMSDANSQLPTYPLQWLEPFSASRSDNREIVDAYFARLLAELPIADYEAALPAETRMKAHLQTVPAKRSFGDHIVPFGRELKANWLTLGKLGRQIGRQTPTLFLVADPTRLDPWLGRSDILKSVVANGENKGPDVVSDIVKDAAHIIVISPNFLGSSQEYSNGDIMWLGPLGLLVSALCSPVKLIRILLSGVASGKVISVKSLFLCVLDAGFSRLADMAIIGDLLMLTSNSHVAEQLRWSGITSSNIDRVVEILHGIPTNELRAYHEKLKILLGDACFSKALFVGLCPDTNLSNIYQGHRLYNRNYTISLKFNALQRDAIHARIADRFEEQTCSPRKYWIAINGATHYSASYVSSPAYQAELAIIGAIRKFARLQRKEVEIVYSIHPAHYKSGQADELIAAIPANRFDRDSLVSWLTCDLCVALYSSSYWDAKYVGSPALLMVSADVGIFAEELLDPGCHIAENQTALQALEETLARVFRASPMSHKEIAARLARLPT
jgi:hypothetical protein